MSTGKMLDLAKMNRERREETEKRDKRDRGRASERTFCLCTLTAERDKSSRKSNESRSGEARWREIVVRVGAICTPGGGADGVLKVAGAAERWALGAEKRALSGLGNDSGGSVWRENLRKRGKACRSLLFCSSILSFFFAFCFSSFLLQLTGVDVEIGLCQFWRASSALREPGIQL